MAAAINGTSVAEANSCDRDHVAHNSYDLILLQKMFIPAMERSDSSLLAITVRLNYLSRITASVAKLCWDKRYIYIALKFNTDFKWENFSISPVKKSGAEQYHYRSSIFFSTPLLHPPNLGSLYLMPTLMILIVGQFKTIHSHIPRSRIIIQVYFSSSIFFFLRLEYKSFSETQQQFSL